MVRWGTAILHTGGNFYPVFVYNFATLAEVWSLLRAVLVNFCVECFINIEISASICRLPYFALLQFSSVQFARINLVLSASTSGP